MKHVKALSIKFLIIGTVIFSILSMFETASILNMFGLTVVLSVLTYVVGDLFILPRFGNVIATIADFGLVAITSWLFAELFIGIGAPNPVAALSVSFFITISEMFFHAYMQERVFVKVKDENKVVPFPTNRLMTEFAKENEVHQEKNKND